MKAFIFPGQGSQFSGMGKELYENETAKVLFDQANDILGFKITDLMFYGSEDDLKQTSVTQPAIFLHSVVLALTHEEFGKPDMVAGHSLGEFSALVANNVLTFENGLRLVAKRANAMQKACEMQATTMAAVLGLEDEKVEEICSSINETVVAANYNCPGQLVISGSIEGVRVACEKLTQAGAKRAIVLPVGGAFHSPFMKPAQLELEEAINKTHFNMPFCPVYQNVTARAVKDPEEIKRNLIGQLTAPVKWTQTIRQMINDGATSFIEMGPGKVLMGLVKKINREVETLGV